MADEDQIFDPSLSKKKKKTKKPFDFEAMQNEVGAAASETASGGDVSAAPAQESEEPTEELDLESFGKKKKKKKVTIVEEKEGGEGADDADELNMEFSDMKKKKKKKKGLKDLVEGDGEGAAHDDDEDKENEEEPSGDAVTTWLGSDRDYTYDELLLRVFDIMRQKNPEMASGTKQKFVMRPPQVVRIGTKKSSFVNFMEICKMLHRPQKHLLDFLLSELGTSGSIDGANQLIIKGRFQQKQIENVLRRYIKEYVTCHTCRSPNTLLQKDSRIFFLQCEACGSRCSVASIKHGFQAVTGKRAAIRAKAT
jgi:translation initiation factor 2 subunit 2